MGSSDFVFVVKTLVVSWPSIWSNSAWSSASLSKPHITAKGPKTSSSSVGSFKRSSSLAWAKPQRPKTPVVFWFDCCFVTPLIWKTWRLRASYFWKISGCNIGTATWVARALRSAILKISKCCWATSKSPGLVQNWPASVQMERANCCAIVSIWSVSISEQMTTGLRLPISAKTGMGLGLCAARSMRARPPLMLPVKPMALICGCWAKVVAQWKVLSMMWLKTVRGNWSSCTARSMQRATARLVPTCIGCALTTTQQPAAKAATVSPPMVE